MILKHKTLRYYYWLFIEFTKKHSRMMLLSFFISFFIVISLISVTPYLDKVFFSRKQVVGMIGNYTVENLPEEVLRKISHGLVFVNEKGETIPALASSWEILDKGKEFRFYLKQGLAWDDSKEFSAKDLNYNFKDVQIVVPNKSTVVLKLDKPLPIAPTYLTKPVIRYPLHGVIGLYKVDKIKTSHGAVTELFLSPNKKDLSPLVYKFYDSESKLISAYKAGEINEMTLLKKNLADTFKDWRNTTISRGVDYNTVLTLFFNTKNPLLAEKDVRQAIALGIPRDKFTEFGEVADGPISPASWAYNPNLKKPLFDLDQSVDSLSKFTKEASAEAQLNFITYYDYLSAATDIEENLNKAGIKTNLTLSNFQNPDQFDLLLAHWKIPQDPDQYFFWHSTQTGSNITNYKNVRIDKLLEDGRSTLSTKDRKEHYMQFQKILIDDLPAVFIYHPYTYTIKRK